MEHSKTFAGDVVMQARKHAAARRKAQPKTWRSAGRRATAQGDAVFSASGVRAGDGDGDRRTSPVPKTSPLPHAAPPRSIVFDLPWSRTRPTAFL